MKKLNESIRIALQKSGRLSDDSFRLLESCGIHIRKYKDQLLCRSQNFPMDLLLVRDDDIPNLVMDGVCDYGIVGTNVLEEKSLQREANGQISSLDVACRLDFGYCHLGIAVPEKFDYKDLQSLSGRYIATSYPFLLREFLKKNQIDAQIVELSGSVEIAPCLDIADAICDLVSTGATLESNNLREVEKIFDSQAVLIQRAGSSVDKSTLSEMLVRRIESVKQANDSKYVMLHAPKAMLSEIVILLPGAEHPTIMSLQGDDQKVAVHAVCRETMFWETMEKLKMKGATSILILPIEKMMI